MATSVLIVGLGSIGMGYDLHHGHDVNKIYTHARAFSLHPDFYLVGAVDPEQKLCEIFEQEYKAPAYSDVEGALIHHKPQLVIIAAPTQYHCVILHKVLEMSEPHTILCEKPLSYSWDEASSMVDLCVKNNVDLYVNYMRRSDPAVIDIKERLDNGQIETPLKGLCWYSKGFKHNGSHFFNLLEFWLGKLESATIIDNGRLWAGEDPEPDVKLVFSRGTVIMLAAWEEKFSHYDIEFIAQNGRLRYESGGNIVNWQGVESDKNFDGYTRLSSKKQTINSGMNSYQLNVAEQLSLSINNDFLLCSGAEALITQKNMHNILEKRE